MAFITTAGWMQTLFYNFSKFLKYCESFFSPKKKLSYHVLGQVTIILVLFMCVWLLLPQSIVVKANGTEIRQIRHHLPLHKLMWTPCPWPCSCSWASSHVLLLILPTNMLNSHPHRDCNLIIHQNITICVLSESSAKDILWMTPFESHIAPFCTQ